MININSNFQKQKTLKFGKGSIEKNIPLDSTQLAKQLFGNPLPTKSETTEATTIIKFLNNLKNNETFQKMLKMMPDGDKVEITSRKGIIDIELLIHPNNYKRYDIKFTDKSGHTDIKAFIQNHNSNTESRLASIFANFTDNCINFLNKHLTKDTKNS